MQVDVAKLRGKIVEHGLTQENFAKRLKMDYSTYYRKMKSQGLCFTISEMHTIARELDLTKRECCEIFFGNNSQKCERRVEGVKRDE